MTKQEILLALDKDIEELEKHYKTIEHTDDFTGRGIALGKISGLLRARHLLLNME